MRTIPLPANYRRTSMPAALNGGPDTQVPAELLDEPGPRLVFAPREFTFWEPDPDQEQEAFPRRHRATLVMAPLWYPMRQLAFDLVLEDPDALTDAMWDQDPRSIQRGPVSAVLLKEIQALLARLTGDPTFISPFLARLRNSGNLAQDALWRRETPHGPETRLMLRGGALHWESFEAMSAHRILRMRRHPQRSLLQHECCRRRRRPLTPCCPVTSDRAAPEARRALPPKSMATRSWRRPLPRS